MNVNSLINTLSIQSESYNQTSMQRYIFRQIAKMNLTPIKDQHGNIYVTKGNAEFYPTMVSHMDTVHDINHNVVVKRHANKLYAFDTVKMEQYGIGGDDKVGVFITLECLRHFDNFKAAFFVDEEVGCQGSSKANIDFFDDSSIILQCDRKGTHDFTRSICGRQMTSEEFEIDINDIMAQYRRTYVNGGMTDVYELSMQSDIVMANMSCGYYNPHTETEYVDIDVIEDTLNFCIDIFTRTKTKQYKLTRPSYSVQSYDYYDYNFNNYIPSSYRRKSFTTPNEQTTKVSNMWANELLTQKCSSCEEHLYYDEYEDAGWCYSCQDYEVLEEHVDFLNYSDEQA